MNELKALPSNTIKFLASLGYTTKPNGKGSYKIVDDPSADKALTQRRGASLNGATIDARTRFPVTA